ncbi:MAG: aldehyde dehydrogenase family protein [Puniceicoccales bacterium]|jgi:acetaldehyde dehydrogenase/alcohol dehydrogenase|nr:aldehyde dehydrogenase family protein [Puniceicoccales bacterium]
MANSDGQESSQAVKTLEDLGILINKVREAQKIYASFPQEKVDKIFKAAAAAAGEKCVELAEMAIAETGMGVLEDKIAKNKFASGFVYNRYKDERTCGIVFQDEARGIKKIVDPMGVIACVIPTTNPTSTAIFKTLIALKTRNGVVISPHPRAKGCTVAAARIVLEASVNAGAPRDIIGWLEDPTIELTNALMQHPFVNIILATGGPAMVKAAYSSGKPALGVGPGNAPVIVDETADLAAAASAIILSKTFDNGMICASEQSIVAVNAIYDSLKTELANRGAYIMGREDAAALGKIILLDKGGVNPAIVGQRAHTIGKLAGIDVPPEAKVLVSEEKSYAIENPYSHEKLSPILALYGADDFERAVEIGLNLVSTGGLGHTAVLHTDARKQERIDYFATRMPVGRVLINAPAAQGAIGLCNEGIEPSLSIGCGSWGGNSVSENITVKHLLNHRTIAEKR